jgi:hypothetical protein
MAIHYRSFKSECFFTCPFWYELRALTDETHLFVSVYIFGRPELQNFFLNLTIRKNGLSIVRLVLPVETRLAQLRIGAVIETIIGAHRCAARDVFIEISMMFMLEGYLWRVVHVLAEDGSM